MNESTKSSPLTKICGDMTERDRRNLNRANLWMAVWLVCYAAATFLIKGGNVTTGPAGWIVAVLPTAGAVVALFVGLWLGRRRYA